MLLGNQLLLYVDGWRPCEVRALTIHKQEAKDHVNTLEEAFKALTGADLKGTYDRFCQTLSLVEDDLKDANRRKPKKAKPAKSVKEEASS